MKRLVFFLCGLLPWLATAQSVTVPNTLDVAGLHLRFTPAGRTAVQQKVDALRRHQASFQSRVTLADAYFPLIDRVFQQEGLPLDFHFLALQESGLQGDAQSIHDAVGYWQFKRESAADFGLVMTDAVDERKHITASSKAAAQYLLRNNKTFHNWINSLLSYNLGLTGTKPYTLPTDYDATNVEISEQTNPYILTFLAHKVAFEPAIGLNTKPPLMLQEFPAPAGQPLAVMAQAMQQDPTELAKYNRWLLAPTVPTDRVYSMLVPITDPLQLTALAAQQKNAASGQLLNKPQPDPENADFVRVNGLRALIALPGDTKESLAQRGKLKMRKFLQYNDLFAFDNIVAGQPYFVQKKRDKAAVEYHVARPGESVATVSQKYGIRAKAIWSKNRMARNEELRAGRVLWLQHTRPKSVPIEYADGNNAPALAAFERPVSADAPASAKAEKPSPTQEQGTAVGWPTTSRAPATKTAPAPSPAPGTSVVQPDSATDEHTENLNDLPPAPTKVASDTPQNSNSTSTAAASASSAPAPRKPLPASAPIADEPLEEATESEPAATPAPVAMPAASPSVVNAPIAVPTQPVVPVAPTVVQPVPASGLHTVEPKENLYSVARRFALRPADIVAWNNLPQNPSLRIGQVLRLTAPVAAEPATTPAAGSAPAQTTATPAATEGIRHTVQQGETLYSISRRYAVTPAQLQEWNNKPDTGVKIGEVLVVKFTSKP
ncbi:LysM peptidoglycan-binding domain-containing protein [Hymenobacter taeanensis]|uniref:LysM peptidoglycan-binding domain-containing protein n=1 Tax=Hymenobacter taeanensis TaxID=2735321 RepID=A0A6M6BCH2_9BACT|nr:MULTISPECIES: LysM peptidoglycan-binding domain-containing protein [Hymenobacter]QJX45916.1 LysM peptidoglycan-binding domain-containing protein [Hymenobacter taeanensis]UOQ79762.1 LysM peptidoglycan-binding domain-containing protein [Hymenobacter sp. 5414T-23]